MLTTNRISEESGLSCNVGAIINKAATIRLQDLEALVSARSIFLSLLTLPSEALGTMINLFWNYYVKIDGIRYRCDAASRARDEFISYVHRLRSQRLLGDDNSPTIPTLYSLDGILTDL